MDSRFFEEKKRFLSSKISKIRGGTPANDTKQPKRRELKENEFNFEWVSKQVEELGATKFKGKMKRDWEAKKIKERGGIPPKAPKTPHHIMIGMMKKGKTEGR